LTEVDAAKSGQEASLIDRLQQEGLQLTYPLLETDEGVLITESPAICLYLAASGSAPFLMGVSPQEQAQVDQWVLFLRGTTLPLAKSLAGAVYGHVEMTTEEHTFVTNELKENLKTLNNQLKSKLWFCGGDQPTVADYLYVLALAELQQCVMDTNLRNSLNNLNNHFKKVAALPEVRGRLGNLKQGKKQLVPAFLSQKKEASESAASKNNKKPAKK